MVDEQKEKDIIINDLKERVSKLEKEQSLDLSELESWDHKNILMWVLSLTEGN